MRHEKSGIWVNSRIQKYHEYIPLLKTYEKKPNSLRSDSVFFFIQRKDLYSGTSTNSLRRPRTRYSQPHLHSTTFTVKKLPCTKGFILLILINPSAGREVVELFTCSRTPRGPAVADHEENDNKLNNIVYRSLKYSICYIYGNSI